MSLLQTHALIRRLGLPSRRSRFGKTYRVNLAQANQLLRAGGGSRPVQTPLADKPEHVEGEGGAALATGDTRSTLAPKKPKRGRPVDKLTVQRAKFADPLYAQGKKWPEIAAAYRTKYPKDLEASDGTIRLACKRQRARNKSGAALRGQ